MSGLTEKPPKATSRLLAESLMAMRSKSRRGDSVNLGDMLKPLGSRGMALGALLVTIPFLWPMGLAFLGAPLTIALVFFGIRMLKPLKNVPMPDYIGGTPIPPQVQGVMRKVLWVFKQVKKQSKPRYGFLVEDYTGQLVCSAAILIGAAILAIPLWGMPLTNTLPAIGVILCILGWTERDGLLSAFGWAMLAFSVIYIIGFLLILFFFFNHLFRTVVPFI